MEDQLHISLEEILVIMQTAKNFKIYEYYDGYEYAVNPVKLLKNYNIVSRFAYD